LASPVPYTSHFTFSSEGTVAMITPRENMFMKREAKEFPLLVEYQVEQGLTRFVVDLSACDYISSEGLGALAKLWKWCDEEQHGQLAVVLSRDDRNEVANLFDITGLARIMGSAVRPSAPDAVSYLNTFPRSDINPGQNPQQ
jgi:anti-anti-sigma factor